MRHSTRLAWMGPAALVVGMATAAPARSQSVPGPNIPDVVERSGLIGRFLPTMRTGLPPDRDRDNFYGTRYGDYPISGRHNSPFGGGLLGLPLDPTCSRAIPPYFNGAIGTQAPRCEDCKPWWKFGTGRVVQGLVHPFRPVGHYYQNGAYVPIYDLGPIIPGPGPDLWPFYHNGYNGG